MEQDEATTYTRRSFLSRSLGAGAAATAFTFIKPELVRGAGKERLRAGLVGCGGRGTEAAVDILTADPSVELVAMGDIFEDKLQKSLANLRDPNFLMDTSPKKASQFTGQPLAELVDSIRRRVSVDPEHCFCSFDAYKKVLASDIDVVLLCTPPGPSPRAVRGCGRGREAYLHGKTHRDRSGWSATLYRRLEKSGGVEADGGRGHPAAFAEGLYRDGPENP